MTHWWRDADLVSYSVFGCCSSVMMAVAGSWARYKALFASEASYFGIGGDRLTCSTNSGIVLPG